MGFPSSLIFFKNSNKLKTNPKISVILPVYNAEKFIEESVHSILNQSYSDFELIIINDGSTDNSEKIILSIKDERIKFISKNNSGLAPTLNEGIRLAKGEFIARQDNDDISLPERFKKQIEFLSLNPEIVLVGTWAEIIDENGKSTGRFHKHPTDSKKLKFNLLFNNPFVHSSIMIRKSVILNAGLYNEDKTLFEDYTLWSLVARNNEVANLPDVLVKYREVNTGMSKSAENYALRVKHQSFKNLKFLLSDLSDEDILDFVEAYNGNGKGYRKLQFYNVVDDIITSFCQKENISPDKLENEISGVLFTLNRNFFNNIIYSKDSEAVEKLIARIRRRFLFFKHREPK